MSSYTKIVNGIVCTLAPAVPRTIGPSGAPIEFASDNGTGVSLPITITFNYDVQQFSITVVGQSFPGHTINAYNKFGSLIDTRISTPDTFDTGLLGGNSTETITVNPGNPISKIELIPSTLDFVGYKGMSLVPAPGAVLQNGPVQQNQPIQSPVPAPVPTVPVVTTPPAIPTQLSAQNIRLADIIVVDAQAIDRQYVKGTLQAIPQAKFNIKNISSQVEVRVNLAGLAGVSFDPANFTLQKNSSQEVTVNFDLATIDTLPEGINTVNAAINLSSNSIVMDDMVSIVPVVPPAPPAPIAATTPQVLPSVSDTILPIVAAPQTISSGWLEERFNGTPPAVTPQALFLSPYYSQRVSEINYDGTLPAKSTFRWTKTLDVPTEANYEFSAKVQDGVRIYVDDVLILDKWVAQPVNTFTVNKTLSVGSHIVRVEHYNATQRPLAIISVRQVTINKVDFTNTVVLPPTPEVVKTTAPIPTAPAKTTVLPLPPVPVTDPVGEPLPFLEPVILPPLPPESIQPPVFVETQDPVFIKRTSESAKITTLIE